MNPKVLLVFEPCGIFNHSKGCTKFIIVQETESHCTNSYRIVKLFSTATRKHCGASHGFPQRIFVLVRHQRQTPWNIQVQPAGFQLPEDCWRWYALSLPLEKYISVNSDIYNAICHTHDKL